MDELTAGKRTDINKYKKRKERKKKTKENAIKGKRMGKLGAKIAEY